MKKIEEVLNNPVIDQKIVDEAKKELAEAKRELAFLESLRMAGVDNWSGYEYAWQLFYEYYPEYREE
jgi:hypothetical protein